MRRWYVAHTRPHAERYAVDHLLRQDFLAYVPFCRKLRRHARRCEMVKSPMFPRYVFVALDMAIDRWRSINGTRGISHLVCFGGRPEALPEGTVETLRAQEDDDGFVSLASLTLFDRGARLRVLDGSFAGKIGIYERMSAAERVVLLFDLLGHEVEVSVPLHAVEAA